MINLTKYVVHCPTEKEADKLFELCKPLSVVWLGTGNLNDTYWDMYNREMCYNFNAGNSRCDYALTYGRKYTYTSDNFYADKTIISVDDFERLISSDVQLEDYIVHCVTEKEADLFIELCRQQKERQNLSISWYNGYSKYNHWETYKERTCYLIEKGNEKYYFTYSPKAYFEQNYSNKKIITINEFADLLEIMYEKYEKTLDKKDDVCYNDIIITENLTETGAKVLQTVLEKYKKEEEKEKEIMCKKNYTPITEVIDFTYKAVKQPFTESGRIIDKNEYDTQDYTNSDSFMLKERKEKIIHTGNKTICIISHNINGKSKSFKGIAYCCRKDKYDKIKGIKIAYLRAKIDALVEELEFLMQE